MTNDIQVSERLIFALDLNDIDQAKDLVTHLGNSVNFYKIGLEMCMTPHYFELMQWLIDQNKKVFADLKFYDVPATVGSAVRQLSKFGAHFATVHGDDSIMQAAVTEKKNQLHIMAVTVLTSLDQNDITKLGYATDLPLLVVNRAQQANNIGCDGVICSGLEAKSIRQATTPNFIIVTPGIRIMSTNDDQKRKVNVNQAFKNGADYIVVGRPIKNHIGFASPRQAAEAIQLTIKRYFETQ